jgi:hypothetical protein
MAETIGDIIARNYSAGRGIGNDFSTARFNRRAEKLRTQYEERAAAEGKPIEDYLPEIEQDLRELARSSGATRRGVRGASGAALDREYAGRLYEDVARSGERRAGAAALSGDQVGARDIRARSQYAIGEFDAGQGQQIAGETIRATQGAMRPDGTYDAAAGAQALSGVGARYGNAEAAAGQQQSAVSFRLQAARAKADSLFNMAQNPSAFSPDQFAGAWEGFKENVPELQNMDLRKGPDDVLYLYTNGAPSGSFDPKNKADVEELATLMGQFTKDPGSALQGYMAARMKSIEESRARDTKVSDDYRAARIDVIKGLTDKGLPADLASKVVEAQQKVSSGGGGWQLQDIGDEPGTFLMQKNGQVYTVKTNVAPDPASGETGGTLQVFDGEGNPVPASVLNREERTTIQSTLVDLAGVVAASNYQLKTGILRDQLQILNELEAQERGLQRPSGSSGGTGGALPPRRGASRAERNNNPGNIEDRGQFKGVPGYLGSDGRFARFDSPEAGQRAFEAQLQRYMDGKTTGRPLTTVAEIISTWSPQSDPTNEPGSTSNYAAYVARRIGVDPNAPLSKADIPRLSAAMAEFESGGTVAAAAPRRPAPGAAPAAAARTAQANPPSAPAAQSPVSRKARISPEYVRGAAGDLRELRSQYTQKLEALEQFQQDFKPKQSVMFGRSEASMPQFSNDYGSPERNAVGRRLEREVEALRQQLAQATEELEGNTGALRRQTAASRQAQSEEDLYNRYGGAADFFRAAP